jgi:hypothetical protein
MSRSIELSDEQCREVYWSMLGQRESLLLARMHAVDEIAANDEKGYHDTVKLLRVEYEKLMKRLMVVESVFKAFSSAEVLRD